MVSIPLPFIVSLLLTMLAAVIYYRHDKDQWPAIVFLGCCAFTTMLVGLRWTTDIAFFRFLMPVSAAIIPATAWYCFARAHGQVRFPLWHLLPPVFLLAASLTYPFWQPPIDPVLTLLYLGYGVALIRLSLKQENFPTQVRLSEAQSALRAERYAGAMLLLSAFIDGAMAISFTFYEGRHALLILTFGHAVILPVLAILVVYISGATQTSDNEAKEEATHHSQAKNTPETSAHNQQCPLTDTQAEHVFAQVDKAMVEKQLYLDPDLTLDRLARKLIIPTRQISAAVNHVCERNISQVINEYRIQHAQALLVSTEDSVTQVYLNSGFQTKSNFNREFMRVVEMTPSEYRKSVKSNAGNTIPTISTDNSNTQTG